MRRRRRENSSGGVQMFSFLDAMICTMGALLVLLHAFARHGEIEVADKAARLSESELASQRDDVAWRIDHLQKSREQTSAELADERLKLSHVEDHERRLREELRRLETAVAEFQQNSTDPAEALRRDAAELALANERLRTARDAVAQARGRSAAAEPAYSVVPYEGPYSTRRRPVYVECSAEAVIIQPEGIKLEANDFAGPLGPGNPLASALRAISEYVARQQAAGASTGEPYPLLLVRPEGIEAYYATRAALVSWGTDFGYELIGSDWKLKFPPPDLQLAELAEQVVMEARARHREYLAAVSQVARPRNRPVYHARSKGGFAATGGSVSGRGGSGDWDSPPSEWSRRGGGAGSFGGSAAGSGSAAGGLADSAAGESGGPLSGAGGESSRPEGDLGAGDTGRDALGPGNADPQVGGSSLMTGSDADGTRLAQGLPSEGARAETGQAGKYGRGGPNGERAANGEDLTQGPPGGFSSTARGAARGEAPDALAARSASGGTNGAGAESSSPAPADGSATGQQSGGESSGQAGTQGGMPPTSIQFNPSGGQKPRSLAAARGKDWGLPNAGQAAIAATRPIRVECHGDRLVIMPEAKNELRRDVLLKGSTQASMDEFVSNVWQHMKSWGSAGRGMYWRPTLVVDVKPGGADRYAEIKALLADSGLDIHERRPAATANRPTVKAAR